MTKIFFLKILKPKSNYCGSNQWWSEVVQNDLSDWLGSRWWFRPVVVNDVLEWWFKSMVFGGGGSKWWWFKSMVVGVVLEQ